MATDSEIRQAAIEYASKGFPIFPCVRKTKQPYTKQGFKEATSDISRIEAWWDEHPGASIGMPTGKVSGKWVLDIDEPGGSESLAVLEKEYGALPDTRVQITGGGGCQYFWKWDFHRNIRNSAGKIGKKLDVRGEGGYVILPPSGHPSGGWYGWANAHQVIDAPDWLLDLVETRDPVLQDDYLPPELPRSSNGRKSAYIQKAFADEIVKFTSSPPSTRNDSLVRTAFVLGQFVGAGLLERGHVETTLLAAAVGIGLTEKESVATIQSGMKNGLVTHRDFTFLDDDDDDFYPDGSDENTPGDKRDTGDKGEEREKEDNGDLGENGGHGGGAGDNQGTNRGQPGDKGDKTEPEAQDLSYSLKSAVKSLIMMDKRRFKTTDIYNELNIRNRQQKKKVSDYLAQFVAEGILERVGGQRGVFTHTLKKLKRISYINISSTIKDKGIMILPLGLEKLGVEIMPGNIIVVAGESNAGKTTLCLNIAHDNLNTLNPEGPFKNVRYFSSEMQALELHRRVKAFGDPMDAWQGMEAVERASDFHQVIDPNGLNIIDFLEVYNEFYLVGEWIKFIHEALQDGVCVIALQKKKGQELGRSQEISLEKPRLYLSVSEAVQKAILSCKIIKAKNYTGARNPNGLEKDFRIRQMGSKIEELTDWQYVDSKTRRILNSGYEVMLQKEDSAWIERSIHNSEYAYTFMVEGGEEKRLNFKDLRNWREEYPWMDVDAALQEISADCKKKPFLKKKDWFWALKSQLTNRYKKISEQRGETV